MKRSTSLHEKLQRRIAREKISKVKTIQRAWRKFKYVPKVYPTYAVIEMSSARFKNLRYQPINFKYVV